MPTLIIISLVILASALFAAFRLVRKIARRPLEGERVRPGDALRAARGRTILVGERHDDRDGLRAALALIAEAHAAGYRALGVEVCEGSRESCSGLDDELRMLDAMSPGETLTEHDARSSLDPGPDGLRPRMNRLWQMRAALALGWKIVPFDPHHWNWMREDEDGYLRSREPAMADAIRRRGPMIAFCGYGHMGGLCALLGDECVYAVCSEVRDADGGVPFWTPRIRFAAGLPRLTT